MDGALLPGGDEREPGPDSGASDVPGRRRFLALAGVAAGAAPLAGLLPGRFLGPSGPELHPAGTGRAHVRSAPLAGPGTADWESLRRALSTRKLIRPGQRSYPTAKQLFDPRFDYKRPAGIAYCGNPRDVSACLAFVRKFGLPVAARSGGHSYAGWSSTTGLIVDVTAMNSFRVTGGSVQVGTGMHLIDMYNQLAARGLAVPGGSCATVGVAGLTLGGGVGVLSRAYGLTSDNLQALQIVTADGRIRDCDATHNSDLYWACRGGGGGNFGIAASFTFRAHHLTRLVVFFLSWPWSRAAQVMAGWQPWAPFQPDALWSNLHMEAAPRGGTPTIQVGGTYLGSVAACQRLLSRLYAAVGSAPVGPYVAQTSYRNAMMLEAGCANLSVSECHLPSQTKNGKLPRVPSYAKSDFFTSRIPASGIRAMVAGIERMRNVQGAAGGVGAVAFDAFGGALNRVSPSATAFVHRNSLFLAQYSTSWNEGGSAAGASRQHAWLRSFYASMRPYASGQAYQNYVDPDLTNWRQAYYGANYARLAQVKKTYDPHQVFRFPQGIMPA
ncbi:MAG TPA: FAD-binding oxidoreductase [Streptosporangiaceae bacterium]|nr:FAD-binding oxidoreductase [Streptosporangiaceae bacterium]